MTVRQGVEPAQGGVFLGIGKHLARTVRAIGHRIQDPARPAQGWRAAAAALLLSAPLLAWASDPQVSSFVDSPDPVAAGGTYTYTVGIDNNAVDAARNTRLTVTVPSGAVFVSATPATQNCAPTNATTVVCNLGTLGALGADVRSIAITWRATVSGPSVINASALVSADNDTNVGNNLQTASTTVIEGANLALAKTGAPDPAPGGGTITYTLTPSNSGPNVGGAMVITDNLPPSVSFVSAAGSGWICAHASGVVTCSRSGTLAVGASAPPVTIVGTVNASGGTVTNSASVAPAAGGVADPDNSNNTATVDTAVVPGADVRVDQKSVTSPPPGTPATAGQNVTFQIQPRNGGPAAAVNAVVTDVLPAGWTFVSASGPNWVCGNSGQTVSCLRGNFPAGATDNISIVATAPSGAAIAAAGTTFTNSASITSGTPDPNGSNNSASVDVVVRPDGADLRLSKSKTPNPVALGANMVSTITVTNGGPRVATGPLRVVEALNGEIFVSATGTGWVCVPSGTVVVCDHPNAGGLAVNASLPTLRITTQATVAGTVSNQACSGGSVPAGAGSATAQPPVEGDANPGNDCATANSTSTTIRPDLAIAKTTSTANGDKVLNTGETSVTYTLVVSNVSVGSDAATGVRFTDTVPGFIVGRSSFGPFVPVVSGGTAVFTCSASGATVTCRQTAGALSPGQTVTVPVIVNRAQRDGSFTNTATVTNTVEGDPNSANNSASDTVTVEPIADVQMTGKTVTPTTVRAGENASYVLSFRNNGPSSALGVVVGDLFTFPVGDTGFTLVSINSTATGSTCSIAAGAQITPAAPSYSCAIGTLANGETQSITLVVRPNYQPGNPARTIGNVASITTTSVENPAGGDNGNNSQSASLPITPAAVNLLTNKTDVVDPVPYYPSGVGPSGGTFLDYRVRVSNAGPSYATGVKITETMSPPAAKRVRFVCDTAAAGSATCNAPSLCSATNITSAAGVALSTFTCDVPAGTATTGLGRGELPSGQSKTVFLRFEAPDQSEPLGDVFNNQAVASANEPDTDLANNTETEPTTTRQRVDLRTTKTSSAANVALNEPFSWTVTVVNNGPGNSLRTDLVDTVPVGAELTGPVTFTRTAPALPGGGTCTVAARTVTCLLGQLDAGGSAVITLPARFTSFPSGGVGVNTATVDTDPAKTGGIDTPGGNNTGISAVTVNRASLTGMVFQDRDRAGANGGTPQTAGSEPRIAGVSLRLTGVDAFGNPVDQSTTTDASGLYSFASLPPSNASGYTVTETQPAGFANGPVAPPSSGVSAPSAAGSYAAGGAVGNSSYSGVVLAAAAAAVNYNFPELRQPSLSGFVYIDVNLNGVRDAGTDTPIAGATVRLLDAGTGAQLATTTTDAGGAYSFVGLDPLRSYTLEEPLPAAPINLGNGPVNPGLVNGVACAAGCTAQADSPAAGTDRIVAIDLGQGVDGTLFNFGERQLTAISGLVYVDANRNNALDATDTARLAGVTVRLVQGADCSSGSTLQTVTTGADGSWRFDNVVARQNYLVCETQPIGYGTGNANGTAGSNVITITALPTVGVTNQLFGETLASLSGTVYQDNGTGVPGRVDNGIKDDGEVGLDNVPVTLTGTDVLGNTVNRTVLTDVDGNWSFDGLLAANASGYTVSEGTIPLTTGRFVDGRETLGNAGGSITANDQFGAIVLAAGAQGSGYLFGELGIAPISGTVYIDLNRNDVIDARPTDGRIPGVLLTLVLGNNCSAAAEATRRTDANGNYSFSGSVVDLTYTVCETQPVIYLQGATNPGVNGVLPPVQDAITITNLPSAGSFGNNFGEVAPNGVIAGRVWLDNNNNALQDTGEAGIAGVVIELTGTDAAGGAVTRSTTTDANGDYRFEGLAPGNYTLTEPTQPGGTLNGRTVAGTGGGTTSGGGSTPSSITGITLGASQTASGNNFGEIQPAGLSGTVFQDRDRSGANAGTPQAAAAEPRIAGVSVRLTGTDIAGNAVDLTATTDANGLYSFSLLAPSNASGYTLTETQPAGFVNGPAAPPTSGGAAPSAGGSYATGGAAGNSSYSAVVLAAAAAATNYNFPEVRLASLAGNVYVDVNFNDLRDPGVDTPISGATVRLLDAGTGALVATTTTDGSGAYAFSGLDPLRLYTLEEPLPTSPANLGNGPANPGLIDGAACASGCTAQPDSPAAGTDRIAAIDLSSGAAGTAFNFGERLLASISGLVYVDANRNNALDASDTGRVGGVTITLVAGTSCAGGTLLQTTTSAANGSYRFDNVVAGVPYLLCEAQPAGYGTGNANGTAGSNQINVPALPAGGSVNNLFGETLASLAGTVYQDNGTGVAAQANNGVKDAGEVGIVNVPVTVSGVDLFGATVSRSTTTDANGNWLIDGLLPPNAAGYTVTEGVIPPASGSFVDGRETVGSAGGSATVNDQFGAIALGAGTQATGYLFGELGLAPISGTVYIDLNRNNALDAPPTDGRVPGVTLTLVQGASCSGTVVGSTTTDANGNYSFSGAAAGLTYTVCETQPAGYLEGAVNPGTNGASNAANAITMSNLPAAGSAGNHFGEIASNSVIAGKVWLDADNSGAINGAEAGIAGVVIELTGTDIAGNAITRTTTTDANGDYRFDNLAPGNYGLRQPTQPAGTLNGVTLAGPTGGTASGVGTAPSTIGNITLGISQTALGNLFGEIPSAQVAGRVYADNNNNGVIDSAETGLTGVTLTLTGTDDTGAAVSRSLATGADGSYAFANLRPGSYSVTEPLQPAGTVNGITSPGSLGGNATPPTVAPSVISAIIVPTGGQSLANNFGEIGSSPDLRVAKSHALARFTVNNAAGYSITVRNAGEIASSGLYTVSDRLPVGLTLAAVPSGGGWACTGAVGDNRFDCSSSVVIAAGASSVAPIAVTVRVGAAAVPASPVNNVAMVDGGGELEARRPSDAERNLFNGNPAGLPVCDPAVLHNTCRDPAPVQLAAAVSGTVWSDIGTASRLLDAGDKRLPGWGVEIVDAASGAVVATAVTGADGSYRVADLVPGIELAVRFRDPASGVVFGYPVNGHAAPGASGASCDPAAAANGTASSCVGSGASPALTIVLASGQELPQQSLPVDPSGVVYDSGARSAVAGAIVTLSPVGTCTGWNPATQLVGASLGGYTINGGAVAMTVGADGFYQYLFAPNAPASCSFAIAVTPPQGYSAPSLVIPPTAGSLSPPGGGAAVFAVQPQARPPTAAPGSATQYWLAITAGSAVANIVHNHLPIDPALPTGISLSKTGDKSVVELGDSVRYSITVQITSGPRPRQTTVVDRLPPGFTYIRGTAMVDGVVIADPVGGPGPVLAFNLGAMPATNRQLLQYRVRVGVGAMQGDGINRAQGHACGVPSGCVGTDGRTPLPGSVATNEGQYRVRVTGGVFATESCVLGKVFVDCNGNHIQDAEEIGIPGVRLVLSDGTNLISDVEGKYSVCGLPPRSHVIRIDPHTLPLGSRLTTSSNRNLGDADSLWLDLKNGELHRADFIEGSCSNTVLDQVKARRAQGEVRAPETERPTKPALRFDSKAHGLDAQTTPQQGTDSANQRAPKPRDDGSSDAKR